MDARQVWDMPPDCGLTRASVVRGSDGAARLVVELTDNELRSLLGRYHLTPRRPEGCQDPLVDLIDARPALRLVRLD